MQKLMTLGEVCHDGSPARHKTHRRSGGLGKETLDPPRIVHHPPRRCAKPFLATLWVVIGLRWPNTARIEPAMKVVIPSRKRTPVLREFFQAPASFSLVGLSGTQHHDDAPGAPMTQHACKLVSALTPCPFTQNAQCRAFNACMDVTPGLHRDGRDGKGRQSQPSAELAMGGHPPRRREPVDSPRGDAQQRGRLAMVPHVVRGQARRGEGALGERVHIPGVQSRLTPTTRRLA